MADNPAEKDDQRYPVGKEKPDDASDAGGRAARNMLECWNDGAVNYWDGSWSGFTCWRCGARNKV